MKSQMKRTWVAHVSGTKDLPQNIIVRAKSEADARAMVQGWLKKRHFKRLDGNESDTLYREFGACEIEVEEALDLEEQLEIDAWLEGEDFDTWKRYIQENRE